MNIATQTDEIDQFPAYALADLPFRRFDSAVCNADKYWEYVLSRSSQTWTDLESFAKFERFLREKRSLHEPAYLATFIDSAGDSFEDDDNLVPASVVLADESPCRWQANSASPFDPFFSPCDLIIGAYVSPQPPVTQKPRTRLRQYRTTSDSIKPPKLLRQLKTHPPSSNRPARFDGQRFRRSTVASNAATPSAPVRCAREGLYDTFLMQRSREGLYDTFLMKRSSSWRPSSGPKEIASRRTPR